MNVYIVFVFQVTELQDVLKSMSNYVFQGGIISADKEKSGTQVLSLETNIENLGLKIPTINFCQKLMLVPVLIWLIDGF